MLSRFFTGKRNGLIPWLLMLALCLPLVPGALAASVPSAIGTVPRQVIGSSGTIRFEEKEAIETTVGTTLVFYEREVQSFPNRWIYLISDESLITVYSDKIENMPGAIDAPGGGNEYREIEFIVLEPGECVISFRNTNYWYIETSWDEDFLSERIYHIIITE